MFAALGGFNVNKLKPNLKMAVNRITIVKNKKVNSIKAQRKEVAKLLMDGKEEKARIRVEGIIREDFYVEAYEILELLCDLLSERASLIKEERECPYDMREAVCTLIWAATRTEIPELKEVKKQLTKKYGQDFAAAAVRNAEGCVNERVIHKLSVHPPNAYLVVNYMKEIAKQHNVDWEPDESIIEDPLAPMAAPTGATIPLSGASGPDYAAVYAQNPPPIGKPPSALPSVPTTSPEQVFAVPPSAPSTARSSSAGSRSSQTSTGSIPFSDTAQGSQNTVEQEEKNEEPPGFSELERRFKNLRRKHLD